MIFKILQVVFFYHVFSYQVQSIPTNARLSNFTANNETPSILDVPKDIGNLILGNFPLEDRAKVIKEKVFLDWDLEDHQSIKQIEEIQKIIELGTFEKLPQRYWEIAMRMDNTFAWKMFKWASMHGHQEYIELLLKDARVNPAAEDNYAIKWASWNGHEKVVELLLKDARVNPAAEDNFAIRVASQTGYEKVVELLLKDARVNPAAEDNHAIKLASHMGMEKIVELLLKDERVNPAAGDNHAITVAPQNGHVKVVELLLKDARVNPAAGDNHAIIHASQNGHEKVVELLLKDARVNPAADDNYAIRVASQNGHQKVVKLLLDDARVNPAVKDNHSIRVASQNGHEKVVELLLQNARVNPAASGDSAIRVASQNGHDKVVELLLKDARVNPAAWGNSAIGLASEKGYEKVVELLLKDERVNPAAEYHFAVGLASQKGYEKVVKLLLKDARVNPAAKDNFAIIHASQNGHEKVVELLLKNARVNPAAKDNNAIRVASQNGHEKVVELLLKNARVNPAAKDNFAIKCASLNGHEKVVELLLKDARVDPSGQNNYAIRVASKKGHVKVVELLLKDARVDPSDQNNYAIRIASEKGHVKVVELLLKNARVSVYSASRRASENVVKENYHILRPSVESILGNPVLTLSHASVENASALFIGEFMNVELSMPEVNSSICKMIDGNVLRVTIDFGTVLSFEACLAKQVIKVPAKAFYGMKESLLLDIIFSIRGQEFMIIIPTPFAIPPVYEPESALRLSKGKFELNERIPIEIMYYEELVKRGGIKVQIAKNSSVIHEGPIEENFSIPEFFSLKLNDPFGEYSAELIDGNGVLLFGRKVFMLHRPSVTNFSLKHENDSSILVSWRCPVCASLPSNNASSSPLFLSNGQLAANLTIMVDSKLLYSLNLPSYCGTGRLEQLYVFNISCRDTGHMFNATLFDPIEGNTLGSANLNLLGSKPPSNNKNNNNNKGKKQQSYLESPPLSNTSNSNSSSNSNNNSNSNSNNNSNSSSNSNFNNFYALIIGISIAFTLGVMVISIVTFIFIRKGRMMAARKRLQKEAASVIESNSIVNVLGTRNGKFFAY